MKTIMMNNEQTAASSVISAKTDGFCNHVMLHLEHDTGGRTGPQYEYFRSRLAQAHRRGYVLLNAERKFGFFRGD